MIATKVKTNIWLVSLKHFIVRANLCAIVQIYTMYTTITTTITILICLQSFVSNGLVNYSSHTTFRYFAHNLFVSAKLYSLDRRFSNTQLVLTQGWLNCFWLTDCFILSFYSLTNVLEMEAFCCCLLKKSTATVCAFPYMYFPHAYCCWFRCSIYLLVCICVHIAVRLCCVCIIHLSHIHT